MDIEKEYRYSCYHDVTLDITKARAKLLGFELNHSDLVTTATGEPVSRPGTLALDFHRGRDGAAVLFTDRYCECEHCGQDHEALVIAFLDWYRSTRDVRLWKMSERQVARWQAHGLGEATAYEAMRSGLSDDELSELIRAAAARKRAAALPDSQQYTPVATMAAASSEDSQRYVPAATEEELEAMLLGQPVSV